MITERYTSETIKQAVLRDLDRLLEPWMVGRPPTYTMDSAAKHTVALGYWLREELTKVCASEQDRRTQEWLYNRHSRTYDIWETAAEVLNEVLEGKVEQNRRPHRRWG